MKNLMVKLITVSTITLFLFSTTLKPITFKPITFPKFPGDFKKISIEKISILSRSRIEKPILWEKMGQLSVGNKQVGLVRAPGSFFLDNKIRGWLVQSNRLITQVAVGYDDSAWAIDGTEKKKPNVYRLEKDWVLIKTARHDKVEMGKTWRPFGNLNLHQISVGRAKPNFIWGVNARGELFYWGGRKKKWAQYERPNNIPLKYVSCGYDGALWVIGKDASVWRWNKKDNNWEPIKELSFPLQVPTPAPKVTLTQVDVGDKDHVVGVDKNYTAYVHDKRLPIWHTIGKGIKNISINKDGDIWLVTTKGDVYRGKFRVK